MRAEPVCVTVSAALTSPAAWPACVRIAASAYGLRFCGISALARECAVGELDQAELVAGVDLEVLRELRQVRGRDRERREQLGVDVPLPGRILRVRDEAVAAEQLGQPRAIERPARAGAAAGAGDAAGELAVGAPQALGVAQGRIGVGQQQVPRGRRLGRLQVGVVGGERVAQRSGRAAPSARRRVGQRAHELGRAAARAGPQRDAERLAARPARAQPAGGVAARCAARARPRAS